MSLIHAKSAESKTEEYAGKDKLASFLLSFVS